MASLCSLRACGVLVVVVIPIALNDVDEAPITGYLLYSVQIMIVLRRLDHITIGPKLICPFNFLLFFRTRKYYYWNKLGDYIFAYGSEHSKPVCLLQTDIDQD